MRGFRAKHTINAVNTGHNELTFVPEEAGVTSIAQQLGQKLKAGNTKSENIVSSLVKDR